VFRLKSHWTSAKSQATFHCDVHRVFGRYVGSRLISDQQPSPSCSFRASWGSQMSIMSGPQLGNSKHPGGGFGLGDSYDKKTDK
jgi:hypothetical protein